MALTDTRMRTLLPHEPLWMTCITPKIGLPLIGHDCARPAAIADVEFRLLGQRSSILVSSFEVELDKIAGPGFRHHAAKRFLAIFMEEDASGGLARHPSERDRQR